jgi:hypothetical protein
MRPAAVWLAVSLALGAASATAGEEQLAVSASCRAEPGSGRQVCRVKIAPPQGERLGWADVLVRSTPPEVRPLRSRVTAAVNADGSLAEAVFGLVANGAASGAVLVQGRAVVCRGERCRPLSSELEIATAQP